MSTRGFISFVIDGQEKTAYNHCDSGPGWLGLAVLHWLRECTLFGGDGHDWESAQNTRPTMAAVRKRAQELRVVDPRSKPTAEDIDRLRQWSWGAGDHGGSQDLREGQEWYDLLRETQGNPGAILSAGVVEDASYPPFCSDTEWGYVVDLDGDGLFEVYQGNQQQPRAKGRFADGSRDGDSYPVALVARWPLAGLPAGEEFKAATERVTAHV